MISGRIFGQRGMTLVELLVAMVISMVLLGGVYQMFVGSTTSNRENEQFARLQENARFAFEVIGRDIRVAGYAGCAGSDGTLFDDTAANLYVPVPGGALDSIIGADAGGNSNLTLRGVPTGDFLRATVVGLPTVTVNTAAGLVLGDVVLVSDCNTSNVTEITGIAANVLTFAGLSYTPVAGNEVVNYPTISYSIQVAAGAPAGTPPGLVRQVNGGALDEIVENVVRMNIRYGIDTDVDGDGQVNNVDTYVTAGAVAGWNQVVAVRVTLLLQSDITPKAPQDTAAYDMNGDGDTVDAEDFAADNAQRLRRVFKSTITLRNRAS